MPNNLDAEQALLGCMIIDNEILPEVLDGLSETDFYQDSHKYILRDKNDLQREKTRRFRNAIRQA